MSFNYYIAKIFVRQCFTDIRINDVPILRQSIDGDFTAQLPINYLIESTGTYSLTVHMTPKSDSLSLIRGASCLVEVWLYDGSEYKIKPIQQVCSSSIKIGEDDKFLLDRRDKKVFRAEVSYEVNRWGDCIRLDNSRQLSSSVATFFQKVSKLLSEKQYDKYLELIGKREENVCTALSLDSENTLERNQKMFELLDNGFEPCPLQGKKFIEFYADKRIVTILDEDFQSALQFENESSGEVLTVELLLGIKKGHNNLCIV